MLVLDRVLDPNVPIYEGMPVDDLGPKFWVRLSHAASRPLYQHRQSRRGRPVHTAAIEAARIDSSEEVP